MTLSPNAFSSFALSQKDHIFSSPVAIAFFCLFRISYRVHTSLRTSTCFSSNSCCWSSVNKRSNVSWVFRESLVFFVTVLFLELVIFLWQLLWYDIFCPSGYATQTMENHCAIRSLLSGVLKTLTKRCRVCRIRCRNKGYIFTPLSTNNTMLVNFKWHNCRT